MSIDFVENYEQLSDEALVDRVKNGEYELFQILLSRYLPKMLYYINMYSLQNDKEDAVQEASYALYSAIKAFDSSKAAFSTFAGICIKRCIIAIYRRIGRHKNIPDELISSIEELEIPDANTPEKIFFDRESFNTLKSNIKLELSGLEFSVLQLFLEGKKYSDIASELDITEKTVNNALFRIRKKINK